MLDFQSKTRKILRECGVFHDGGHFVYSSGLHGDFYINKDALYSHPLKFDDVCVMLTDTILRTFGSVFDIVLAPAVSGIALGANIAYNLSLEKKQEVLFAFADKNPFDKNLRTIRRGYQVLMRSRNVLLVDDVVTTGRTLVCMAQSVTAAGGRVGGAAAICDRGNVRVLQYAVDGNSSAELTISTLVELDLKIFKPDKCPFCKAKRPIDMELGDGIMFGSVKPTIKSAEGL